MTASKAPASGVVMDSKLKRGIAMTRCIICDYRPAQDEQGYCNICASKLKAERQHQGGQQPVNFLTYRGNVVGLFNNGNGKLTPRLLRRNPDNLPGAKTLNLNRYLPGFDRAQIKRFKRCILQLA